MLAGGAALAHGITALSLPILSRLYAPSDFGTLAVFSSLLSIISSAACLRFDIAIPIPENENDAFGLLALAIICAILVALGLAVAIAISPQWIATNLNQPQLQPYLWLLPVGVFLSGTYSSLQHWFVRRKLFPSITRSRITQSAVSSGTQLCLGWIGITPLGLLIGYVMNTGMACLMLATRPLQEMKSKHSNYRTNLKSIQQLYRRYDKFPKYSTLEALCNSAAVHIPIVMIAAFTTPTEAGLLTMAMTVMQAPMALIGTSVGQVYLSRAPQEWRNGQLGNFTTEILGGLSKAGLGPLLAAGIIAPHAFGLIFGPTWERAGWLVTWMTPWFIMQFLASPISMALHVTGNQRKALLLQIFGLIFRVTIVLAASRANLASEAYGISGFIFYFTYLLTILNSTQTCPKNLIYNAISIIKPTMLWLIGSGTISLLIEKLII